MRWLPYSFHWAVIFIYLINSCKTVLWNDCHSTSNFKNDEIESPKQSFRHVCAHWWSKKKRFLLKSLFMFHILLNYTYTCSHSFSYVTENTLVDSNFSHIAYHWQFLFLGNLDNNLLILAYQFIAFTCIVRRFQHTEAIYVIQNLKPPRTSCHW